MTRVRVLTLNAALGPLDYRVPPGVEQAVGPGSIVEAPLGPRRILGVVWEEEHLPDATTVPDAKLRPLYAALPIPPIPAPLRRLVEWVADYYMAPLAARWANEHPNLTFIPVLSEPKPEDNWIGRIGLVHQAILDDFPSLAGYQVYACGAPAMIDAGRKAFFGRGLPEEEFFADSFTYSAPSPTT